MIPLFAEAGVHAIVDGQYGSTGKGALAYWLAKQAIDQGRPFHYSMCSAGPNSGHTFYHKGEKHVLKQLPSVGVAQYMMGKATPIFLTAGAIINASILAAEAGRYPGLAILVHPNAALITNEDILKEHSGSVREVAGTRSGTGAALARKVLRDPKATIANGLCGRGLPPNVVITPDGPNWRGSRIALEVSQGFSLGINDPQFYPKTTSRECTAVQGLADARLPARSLARTYMAIRTFPIRVGNVDGFSSGDCYSDQHEISWHDIGVQPERTTVTNRVRRVFTFSWAQLDDAVRANDPDFVFINFMNYFSEDQRREWLSLYHEGYSAPLIQGFGPNVEDVRFG